MPQLLDNIYLGPSATGVPAGAGMSVGATVAGIGPVGRSLVYDIVPLTISATNLATSQSPGTSAITLGATTGITTAVVNGITVLQMDVPRILRITSGGNDTGITFNAVGFDVYGQAMTENITGASGGVASGKKAWFQVQSIVPSASAATTVTVGTGDVFGLPIAVVDVGYIASVKWNETLASDAGTFVSAVVSVASKTTGDVRGTYTPSANASNGVRRLVVNLLLSNAQVGSTAVASAIVGVTQA